MEVRLGGDHYHEEYHYEEASFLDGGGVVLGVSILSRPQFRGDFQMLKGK